VLHFAERIVKEEVAPHFHQAREMRPAQYVQPVMQGCVAVGNFAEAAGDRSKAARKSGTFCDSVEKVSDSNGSAFSHDQTFLTTDFCLSSIRFAPREFIFAS
jgi:hypothetical protein